MRKRCLAIPFACLLATVLPAQTQVDSLRAIVRSADEDTSLVMVYRQLFKALYEVDKRDEMLEVAEKGLALSRMLDFTKGIDLFIYYKASALDVLGRGHEAIPLYEEGVKVAQELGDPVVMADYYGSIGLAYYALGDFDKALENYTKAHDIYEQEKALEPLAKMLNNIAVIYRLQSRYERAVEIYQQSFQLKKQLGDSLGMAASLQNLGVVYGHQNLLPKAVESLEQGLALFRQLGAQNDVAGCYLSLGEVYYKAGNWSAAKAVLDNAFVILEKSPSPEYHPQTLFYLGKVEAKQGKAQAALSFLEKSLQLSRQYGQKDNVLRGLLELSKLENQLGRSARAYLLMEQAIALKDSLTEEKRLSLQEEMQARFNVGQKENELKISQLELSQRTLERNWLMAGAGLLVMLAVSIFYAFRNKLRLNKRIAEHQAEIQQQRIRQLEQENQLTALCSMLEGQEQERSRIAGDLHDSLGGLLASIKSHFNAARQPNAEADIFEKTNTMLDGAATEVRRISHNMMPRALTLSGLKGALEDLAQDLERQGLSCNLELVGLDDLPLEPARSVMAYRIVQELTHNAMKHAQATHLLLQAIQHEGRLTLLVEDDGKGFNVEAARQKNGIGLSSIESRVQFLKGEIEWDSVSGEGTTVSVSFPLNG